MRRFRLQAIFCALLLAFCVWLVHPVAETGMTDDWSYIRTAQVFAATGHVVYNGWGAPGLGFQLLPAVALIKLFGFSFTIVRLSTVLIGLATCLLIHRIAVRCGITEWNASIATLTLMLSPLMLPTITSFLTDAWCLFSILFCLYACIRALQTPAGPNAGPVADPNADRAAILWIATAALGNALTGTVRQVAWLGVIVMVPCALWLLRPRRRVLTAGIATWIAACLIVLGYLHWLNRQPYTVAYSGTALVLHNANRAALLHLPFVAFRTALEIPLLLLPLLLMFFPALRTWRRSVMAVFAGVLLTAALAAGIAHAHHQLSLWLVPFIIQYGSIFSAHGVYVMWPVSGSIPQTIPEPLRLLIAVATVIGLAFWLAALLHQRQAASTDGVPPRPSWHTLFVLLLPFSLAYIALIAPSAFADRTIDRYLIPLIFVAGLLLVRQYEDCVAPRLPAASMALALFIAGYSVASMHDAFALYRAVLHATGEVQASGVPRRFIDGGWEYDGWTQITEDTYIHETYVRIPGNAPLMYAADSDRVCRNPISYWTPHIDPLFALSFDPTACGGSAGYAPVAYNRWLAPRHLTLYIVRNPQRPGAPPRAPGDIHLMPAPDQY